MPTLQYTDHDVTILLAQLLVGIAEDRRPEMAEHHNRIDLIKAVMVRDMDLDAVFTDELLAAWNEIGEMSPAEREELAKELAI